MIYGISPNVIIPYCHLRAGARRPKLSRVSLQWSLAREKLSHGENEVITIATSISHSVCVCGEALGTGEKQE